MCIFPSCKLRSALSFQTEVVCMESDHGHAHTTQYVDSYILWHDLRFFEDEHLIISFPTSESFSWVSSQPAPHIRPFRRISLPSLPSVFQRNSVESVSSFRSSTESREARPGTAAAVLNSGNLCFTKLVSANSHCIQKWPTPTESPERHLGGRRSNAELTSDANFLQRKQVVDEFYATEKSYVDGLELIYSVRILSLSEASFDVGISIFFPLSLPLWKP